MPLGLPLVCLWIAWGLPLELPLARSSIVAALAGRLPGGPAGWPAASRGRVQLPLLPGCSCRLVPWVDGPAVAASRLAMGIGVQ